MVTSSIQNLSSPFWGPPPQSKAPSTGWNSSQLRIHVAVYTLVGKLRALPAGRQLPTFVPRLPRYRAAAKGAVEELRSGRVEREAFNTSSTTGALRA